MVAVFTAPLQNKAQYDAFQIEALTWMEKYASSEAIPALQERLKRSDTMLDEKRRLQEALEKIQKRGGG